MYRKGIEPVVSVVMSLYQEPIEWMKLAIDSILNQTFRDFELILINDQPNRLDNRQLLEEYFKIDNRIVTVHNDENIGLTKSLNKGLEIARGHYIARMDADDIAKENRLELQFKFLQENSKYICCGSFVNIIDANNNFVKPLKLPETHQEIQDELVVETPMIHPTLFFRNIHQIKYNESIRFAQDYDLIYRLSLKGQLYNLETPLLEYRRSSVQISNAKLSEQTKYANDIRERIIIDYLHKYYGVSCVNIPSYPFLQNLPKGRLKNKILFSFLIHNNFRKNHIRLLTEAIRVDKFSMKESARLLLKVVK
ncbi:glycosyltransferase [Sediminitomix flava]|uniref:Glycosyl transferase family 2 n=1 Tax=Sediminitomix flava TaxID=379075 RepID=A0A315Z7V3_SEDFL|nr:glycosyltransferase [Sediminitomix flava]PWJ40937.1 glycosyl transferase family 2 [Sediminitomix flava]